MVGLNFRNWSILSVLAMIFAATSALLIFIKVAGEVVEGDTRKYDEMIIKLLRVSDEPTHPLGPIWLVESARDITALGSPVVLGLFVLITTVYLLIIGQRFFALFILVSTVSGTYVDSLLKLAFGRSRPNYMLEGMIANSASFPSGHAMLSAVVYLTLGALVTRLVPGIVSKLYIMVVAVTLTGLIGLSRVYLGVHWPSDVLAGWAAGAAWALGGGAFAQSFHLGKIGKQ